MAKTSTKTRRTKAAAKVKQEPPDNKAPLKKPSKEIQAGVMKKPSAGAAWDQWAMEEDNGVVEDNGVEPETDTRAPTKSQAFAFFPKP